MNAGLVVWLTVSALAAAGSNPQKVHLRIDTGWNLLPITVAVHRTAASAYVSTCVNREKLTQLERSALRGVRLCSRKVLGRTSAAHVFRVVYSVLDQLKLRSKDPNRKESASARVTLTTGRSSVSYEIPREGGFDEFQGILWDLLDRDFANAVQSSLAERLKSPGKR